MFQFAGSTASVDPDKERSPPSQPTIVYFPQDELDLKSAGPWGKKPPDLVKAFATIQKPSDVKFSQLQHLNITFKNDVEIEDFVPTSENGTPYLPPPPDVTGRRGSVDIHPRKDSAGLPAHSRHPLLSNGARGPDAESYLKYIKELACETDDGLRAIGRRKTKQGRATPQISIFRSFWGKLDLISQFWDTSLDNYYEATPTKSHGTSEQHKPLKGLRKMSAFLSSELSPAGDKPKDGRRYKGRRIGTGAKMPEHYRTSCVRDLVAPITDAFGCILSNPRKTPLLEIQNLQIPVTQTAGVWRTPQDKALAKRGILEGPVLAIQCRAETGFVHNPDAAGLDVARELACILLLAQERAREGKAKVVPGEGKWYTSVPRWGGGPGGEFGEAEGNTDSHHGPIQRRVSLAVVPSRQKTEEETWKELRPGTGVWEPRTHYIAVGTERGVGHDTVFLISSLYHHVSLLRLDCHVAYLEYLLTGKAPPFEHPDKDWSQPKVSRTKWYDLLVTEDRTELVRGIWGIMAYQMRPATAPSDRPMSARQPSEASGVYGSKKKSSMSAITTQRSHSVAF